jgi:hypothetical protein
MKALITIIILILIGLAAWLVMRNPDDSDLGADNSAAAAQSIQTQGSSDADIDLGEFQDKG